MTPRLLATGAILLAIGLTLAAVVAEWFAAFDACLASASCVAPGSISTLGSFLALLAVGLLLAVAGGVAVLFGLRGIPTQISSSPN